MIETTQHDAWQAGDAYEQYMGRWSRQLPPLFLECIDTSKDPIPGAASSEIKVDSLGAQLMSDSPKPTFMTFQAFADGGLSNLDQCFVLH